MMHSVLLRFLCHIFEINTLQNNFSLRRPLCKPKKKDIVVVREPIDPNCCVFCLGDLYTGGYLHELFDKIPKIKKQSEEYKDEISWRIEPRVRVIVHKKCYDSYIDRLAHKENAVVEESESEISEEDLLCGEEKAESEPEDVEIAPVIKTLFCLKKFQPPPISSGKFSKKIKN